MLKENKYIFVSASMWSSHYKIIKELQLDQADNKCIKTSMYYGHITSNKAELGDLWQYHWNLVIYLASGNGKGYNSSEGQ